MRLIHWTPQIMMSVNSMAKAFLSVCTKKLILGALLFCGSRKFIKLGEPNDLTSVSLFSGVEVWLSLAIKSGDMH